MTDYKRDLLETIHSEQGFGKSVYIKPEDLTIYISYDKPEDESYVYLGIPVTDEDYEKWFFNQEDNQLDLTDCYLTGEVKDIYDKYYKLCEDIYEKNEILLEENGISSYEKIVNNPNSVYGVLPDEIFENLQDLHSEIKSYIVSDELNESINSFSYYSGAWQNISDYESFLSDDSDRLNFIELTKAYSIYAFKNAKNTEEFQSDFDDNELDTEAILDFYAESIEDLPKDRLLMLSNIQTYFSSYPTDYGFLKKYASIASDKERLSLINNNRYINVDDLVSLGFYPKSEEEALELIEQSPHILGDISADYGDNLKLVLLAVKSAGATLQYASDRLRNDPTVVLEAVLSNKHTIEFASEEIISLCEGTDPAKALENLILKESLSKELKTDLVKPNQKKAKL